MNRTSIHGAAVPVDRKSDQLETENTKTKTHDERSASTKKAWIARRTPMPERFWMYVDKRGPDDCWPFNGQRQHYGHGNFKLNGKCITASRVAWELANGPIPDGLDILHHCDNPPCCNPKHLYAGTHADNMRDASDRHRFPDRHGENSHRAKLTNQQAQAMREEYRKGLISRKDIARKYGMSESGAKDVLSGKYYSNI